MLKKLKQHIRWKDPFLILIGALIAIVADNWSYFTFSKEISVSDLFTAAVGGTIGLYLGKQFSSQASSDRVEKDLFISEIKLIKVNVQQLATLIEYQQLNKDRIIALFKTISTDLYNLIELLKLSSNEAVLTSTGQNTLFNIRRINATITSSRIVNESFIISDQDSVSLSNEVRKSDIDLFKLIIHINKTT